MRISVIVPTLNEEKLLPRMLAQFTPAIVSKYGIEIVVSDGGSRDRTLEIAREREVVVVESGEDVKQTISVGRNLGARASSGDLLVFLNADTLIPEIDAFFAQLIAAWENEDLCAATCSVRVYPEEERLSDVLFHGFYNWFFYMMNVVGMAMGRGECHVITRKAYDRVGGYADAIAAGEDYDMFRRLSQHGKIRFLRDLFVYESPRRYRKYGYLFVTSSWFLNFLSVFFLGRSILSQWKPVR